MTLAAIPASFALYKFTRQDTNEQPFFTRFIRDTYDGYKEKWANRNDMHTQMIEQAAADRVLFLNESQQTNRRVDLRFPEYDYTSKLSFKRLDSARESMVPREVRMCADTPCATGLSTQDPHGTFPPVRVAPTSIKSLRSTRKRHSRRTRGNCSNCVRTRCRRSNPSSRWLKCRRLRRQVHNVLIKSRVWLVHTTVNVETTIESRWGVGVACVLRDRASAMYGGRFHCL